MNPDYKVDCIDRKYVDRAQYLRRIGWAEWTLVQETPHPDPRLKGRVDLYVFMWTGKQRVN